MKTKLLFLSALLVFSLSVFAVAPDFSGDYGGTLVVVVDPLEPPTTTADTVMLALQGDGTYTLSITDFVFDGMPIGDIVIDQIVVTNVLGIDSLNRTGSVAGPTILGMIPTVITLGTSYLTSGTLLVLNINVNIPAYFQDIPVNFFGSKIVAGISESKIENIGIVPSLATDYIKIPENIGSDYVIYNTSGSPVKSGKLTGEDVNVSTLPSGLYFFTIEGKSGKFIKK